RRVLFRSDEVTDPDRHPTAPRPVPSSRSTADGPDAREESGVAEPRGRGDRGCSSAASSAVGPSSSAEGSRPPGAVGPPPPSGPPSGPPSPGPSPSGSSPGPSGSS